MKMKEQDEDSGLGFSVVCVASSGLGFGFLIPSLKVMDDKFSGMNRIIIYFHLCIQWSILDLR